MTSMYQSQGLNVYILTKIKHFQCQIHTEEMILAKTLLNLKKRQNQYSNFSQ